MSSRTGTDSDSVLTAAGNHLNELVTGTLQFSEPIMPPIEISRFCSISPTVSRMW